MNKKILLFLIPLVLFGIPTATFMIQKWFSLDPTDSPIPVQTITEADKNSIVPLYENLDTPWAIAVLPDERLLVTERSGIMRIISEQGARFEIADVVEQGEGGLLGLTLHPDFSKNQQLYIYKTTGQTNEVERYRLNNNRLTERTNILSGIPAATNHNGGEIKFGPDRKLYITTGDAAQENLAQDSASLAGKILRTNDDGTTPPDNPFRNPVWSYGHRNPQGIAWDDQGRLWSTEHGPSGSQTGYDELNLVEKGKNYGWPVIRGDETREGMVAPVAQSGANDTWAPAGMAYVNGSLYFAGLRGQTLYQAKITGNTVQLSRHITEMFGRLRAVTVLRDRLFVSTSNQDGRGTPRLNDDKILTVPLQLLQ